MKKADVSKFKKKLEELRAQLTHSLKGSTAEVKTPDEATGDFSSTKPIRGLTTSIAPSA